jgi:glycosyltransferase involved in cell wall biosynthesis
MIKEKKLTICIPTFNRLKFIEKQLGFFKEQFGNNKLLMPAVEFIVADNASTDDTAVFLSKYKNKHPFFNYVVNPSNLGLVGNVVNLLNLSKTEYVWFVSDDDDLKPGVVENILEIIENNDSPELIYLNYSLNGNSGFTGKEGLRVDSKKAVLDVFREFYGSLVLITACVYKRNNLNELSNNPMFEWLSAPLLYSFYSGAKGPVYLTNEVWIDYRMGNASYAGLKTISKLKFEQYVPILESLPKFGFDQFEIKKTIKLFFEIQSHAHLLYNFINLSKSLKLYKYYTFKTVLKMPLNIIRYLKK